VVDGPLPDRSTALALAKEWSCIQIGREMPEQLAPWKICTRAFREHLVWAVSVPGVGEPSLAVASLLEELAGRGIELRDAQLSDW
jgi:hypothetical protein